MNDTKNEAPVCMECGRAYTDENPEAMFDGGDGESGPRMEFTATCVECDSQPLAVYRSKCPQHDMQEVVGTTVSGGPDPYEIEHLACGCKVIWFSGEDAAIVG